MTEPEKSQDSQSHEDAAAIATRFANAIELARQEGIYCTGSPTQPDCDNPALCAVRLHAELFALPCSDHIREVLNAIFAKRHAAVVTISIAELLEEFGDKFKDSAAYIRDRNHARGVIIPPMPSMTR